MSGKKRYQAGRFASVRFAAGKWRGTSAEVEEPDFMHGSLVAFPYLIGDIKAIPHVSGEISVRPTIVGKVEVNP